MSSIGGPGGVGPKGPPTGVSAEPTLGQAPASAAERALQSEHAAAVQQAQGAHGAQGAQLRDLDALASEVAAGRLSPRQAIDTLVEAASADLAPTERAELRELLTELFANDPHLRGLVGSLGG